MKTCDILVKDCRVLQPDMSISEPCSVVIDGSWIKEIGTTADMEASYQAAEILDGKNKLMMPGFVDAHTHTCQQLLRGRPADEYPMVWTRFLVPFESNLLPEDSYVSAKMACLEMIKNGTTSFADSGGVHMADGHRRHDGGRRPVHGRDSDDDDDAIYPGDNGANRASAAH